MDLAERITGSITDHRDMIDTILKDSAFIKEVERSALIIAESLCSDGTVFAFGNGGSAADAQHIVAELVGRFEMERMGLRAIALSTDGSTMTSLSNDFGYDGVFAHQIDALGRPGDVAIAISTSGKSPSIIKGIEKAKEKEMLVIGLTGKGGDRMLPLCDAALIIPSHKTPRIQEGHVLVYHILCGLVEQAVCARK